MFSLSRFSNATQRPTALLFATLLLSAASLQAARNDGLSTPSKGVYDDDAKRLVVYTDVPGSETAPQPIESTLYRIRVRSAATGDQWVECFANSTYNRADEIPDINQLDGGNSPVLVQHYQILTRGWSHTYANIELTPDTTVEVEISKKDSTPLNSSAVIAKYAVHPASKIFDLSDQDGKVFFKINNPCQVVIDINGQMDDHNAAVNPMPNSARGHGLSLFANPILPVPNTGVVYSVSPGTAPTTDPAAYDTMIFQPGVHIVGTNFKIHPGKTYHIPGDAVVYGTFNNIGVPAGGKRSSGDSITFSGYGTISGSPYTHYLYLEGGYPYRGDVGIAIDDGVKVTVHGPTIVDTPNFSTHFFGWNGPKTAEDGNVFRWVKVITWRANGDGIGGYHLVEDCFLRTADDASYAKSSRRRCTFWKDANAALFHMATIPSDPVVIEDCDVIYNRLRIASGPNGGGFQLRGGNGNVSGNNVRDVDVTIRNFRFHDKRSNMSAVNLISYAIENNVLVPGEGYRGLRFENISIEAPINGVKQKLLGCAETPWYGGLIFKNITIGGVLLTRENFNTCFQTNEFVDFLLFDDPRDLTLTTIAQGNRGVFTKSPDTATHPEMSLVQLTAIPKPAYVFTGWSDPALGTANPLTLRMTDHRTVTANFEPAPITDPIEINNPGADTWQVPPGVFSMTVKSWGGGGAGGSAACGEATSNTQVRGGGGSGGAFAEVTLPVTPGQTISYSVGDGASGAEAGFTDGTNAASGSSSSVQLDATMILSAPGGTGGKNIFRTNALISGSGGTAPNNGGTGLILRYGGNGATANSNGTGGGGGSAGRDGNGGGAPSPFTGSNAPGGIAGAGGGANGGAGHNNTAAGNPGNSPGAGGSGAAVRNNSPFTANNQHRTGGKGGDGRIIVTYNTMTFSLNMIGAVNGRIISNPAASGHLSGTTVTLNSVANDGYYFAGWSGSLSGRTNPYALVMDGGKTIGALFNPLPTLKIERLSDTEWKFISTNLQSQIVYQLQASRTLQAPWESIRTITGETETNWTIPVPPGEPRMFYRLLIGE